MGAEAEKGLRRPALAVAQQLRADAEQPFYFGRAPGVVRVVDLGSQHLQRFRRVGANRGGEIDQAHANDMFPKMRGGYALGMCRNIRTLHNFDPPATQEEVHDAALQFVRKVSGSTKPSKANAEAFERAVEEVAASTAALLDALVTKAPAKNREVEAEKRKARSAERFATA